MSKDKYDAVLDSLAGVSICWYIHCDNTPDILFDSVIDLGQWDNQVYEYCPAPVSGYISCSGDGRYEIHYHGPLYSTPNELGQYETTPSQGYGGRKFHITMVDGRKACLIGPWHGSAPQNFEPKLQDISYRNVRANPDGLYLFGIKFEQDLVEAAMKRFHPDIPLVRSQITKNGEVTHDFGWTIDKRYAPQSEIIKYLEQQKSDKSKEYAMKRLKKMGIQYA